MKLSGARARRLILAAQGLDGHWKMPGGKQGTARVIERLGYVQIDTIAVIERAHHHTLWSRYPAYAPWMLDELQSVDRRVFEYWAPAASYLPMADYRYYLPRMRAFRTDPRTRRFLEQNRALVEGVLERIRKEGALRSADFAAPPGRKRGSWWDWKPAKRALETLFWVGELMIAGRRNFQRIYDLRERVLPPDTNTTEPDPDELARFRVRRLLSTQGVSALRSRWRSDRERITDAREALVDAGEVTPVEVEGLSGQSHYALTRMLEQTARRSARRRKLHILSPFDNLVIERDRTRDFFRFECKLEAYTPAPKRVYGYFCLPLLWGDAFVGRIDSRADRREKTLVVHTLRLEPGFRQHDALLPELARKLRAFASFNGCEGVRVEETLPRRLRAPLRRALASNA